MNEKRKNSVTVLCIRLSLLVICLVGLAVCVFWYPFQISLTAIGVPSGERVAPTNAQLLEYWIQLAFYWLASVPCFAVLIIGWTISGDVKSGQVFSEKNSLKLRRAAVILTVDSVIFLLAQLIFTALRWNPFVFVLTPVGVIGLIFAFSLYLSARYVSEAAKIKEENEGYI